MIFGKVQIDLAKLSDGYRKVYGQYIGSLTDETTSGELFANYFLGIIMIASFFISSVANPFLFWFNWQEKKRWTLSKTLFVMLAISDFLTNLFKPIKVAKNLLSPEILPAIRNGTHYEAAESVFFQMVSLTSILLTASIATCRFTSVRSPFSRLSAKVFTATLIPIEILMLAFHTEMIVGFSGEDRVKTGKMLWFLYCQLIFSREDAGYGTPYFLFKTSVPGMISFFGVLLSGLTVVLLLKKRRVDNGESIQKKIKAAYAVVAMNFATSMAVVVYIVYQVYQLRSPVINFLGACGNSIILSAFNPLVRIYFSSEMRNKVRNLIRRIRFSLRVTTQSVDLESFDCHSTSHSSIHQPSVKPARGSVQVKISKH